MCRVAGKVAIAGLSNFGSPVSYRLGPPCRAPQGLDDLDVAIDGAWQAVGRWMSPEA